MMNNYEYGGGIENENAEMVMNNNNQIKHHTEELEKIVTPETEVPAWVVSKVGRSASDLSDATHYLDGVSKIKYADGGGVGFKVGDFVKKKGSNLSLKVLEISHNKNDGKNYITIYNDVLDSTQTVNNISDYELVKYAKGSTIKGGAISRYRLVPYKEKMKGYIESVGDKQVVVESTYDGASQKAVELLYSERDFVTVDIVKLGKSVLSSKKIAKVNSQGIVKYADGGSIPNNYEGKAVRHIWNSWSVSQRKHFLHDHNSNEVQDSYGEYRTEYLSEVEIENIAEVNYEDLPQDIKTKVFIHTDMGQYADGGVAYNPIWAEMEAYSPYSSRSEYETKKEYDDLTFASKSFTKSAEILVKENLMNGEICISKLRKILGHEPSYPVQYVGSIKLTKCFLKPFYKI